MNNYILFILLFFGYSLSAQSLDRLDQNNGFKHLKFGLSPTQIKDIVKKESVRTLNGVTQYKYIGGDITSLHGIKIDAIDLFFYNNKLYTIMIGLGSPLRKYEDSDYDIVQNTLEVNFGSRYHNCSSGRKQVINCAVWDSNRVRCEHVRMNLSENDGTHKQQFNYISGYLLFINKPLETQQQSSEF